MKKPLDALYQDLSPEAIERYKEWARKNYQVNTNINEIWHPIIKEECKKINTENDSKEL